MKVIFTLLITVLIAGCLQAQTTIEEYNYLTKGYKIQIESGLDMKKGYTFKDLFVVSTSYDVIRKATFKALYRAGQTAPCAIVMIYQKDGGIAEYVCIPHFLSEEFIWNMYRDRMRIFDNSVPGLQTVSLGLAKCTGYFSQNN